jgi:hypothetical protein
MMPTSVKPTRILLVVACLALTACASSGTSESAPRRSSSTRISTEELQQSAGQDLYTVVQRLRPQWFVVRGGVTAQGRASIAVILDGVRQQGSLEVLRSLKAADTEELRFINARDATTRYGTDMTAGAIEVITKR